MAADHVNAGSGREYLELLMSPGYKEWRSVELAADPAWEELAKHCPRLKNMDLIRFTLDFEGIVPSVQPLVDSVFNPKAEHIEVESPS